MQVLIQRSETMVWREKERSKIRAVKMNNFTNLLGIRRTNKCQMNGVRDLYGVKKGVDEGIDENVLQWFGIID